ncbi:putative deoxyribonuclease RhsC [Alteripontixanthobacter maritimus]|uniref:Putative deoxyribonuclease RhsC n=1 Tax=Alteripontixanthobacter maritimus TaxID=2161824 RepID=A0A369Q9T1_9SPHN|nr:RHS repeat-associated core domain-containing protein [Alteripontixanthobacter maritimus]RDC60007.1 putative deoxyribonuclease RhsC [Alteripontixanthobacter maritimus]
MLADLYYNRYRDYDPTTGRYIQANPIGLAGGSNPYIYVEANPINKIDPLGLFADPGHNYTKSPRTHPRPPSPARRFLGSFQFISNVADLVIPAMQGALDKVCAGGWGGVVWDVTNRLNYSQLC